MTVAEYFNPEHLYDDDDVELDVIGSKDKRAQWRHRRFGPAYIKMGRRVKYSGEALNEWIDENTVQTNQVA
jgi:hypothetical protein